MNTNIDTLDFFITVIVAMIAGAAIGVERQFKNKNAGLKTYSLVALGAAIFVNIAQLYSNMPDVDDSRILSHIIVGVGFLGAGVILQRKKNVSGMATAATIWCSAGLGCLAALKLYIPLVICTVLIVAINSIFGYWNKVISKHNNHHSQEDCR